MPDDRTFRIDYRLVGSGWAECDVRLGPKKVALTASYLSDALGQLAAAALLLRLGAHSARVSFDEEPGEYRWGFDWYRLPDGSAVHWRVRIWSFDELWGHKPDEDGEVLFDEIIDAAEVLRAVLRTLDAVLAAYGEEQYRAKWVQYPFPAAIHQELGRMIDEWPGRRL